MTAPVPEGYPRVTPYLIVAGASEAIRFYTEVLGFTERMRMPGPDGLIGHAELELGDVGADARGREPGDGHARPAAGRAVACDRGGRRSAQRGREALAPARVLPAPRRARAWRARSRRPAPLSSRSTP